MTIQDVTNSVAEIIPVALTAKVASSMLNETNRRYRNRYKKNRKFKW